jgi:hypothetical protein
MEKQFLELSQSCNKIMKSVTPSHAMIVRTRKILPADLVYLRLRL